MVVTLVKDMCQFPIFTHYCPVKKMIWDKSDIEQAQGLFFFPTQEFIQVVLNKES